MHGDGDQFRITKVVREVALASLPVNSARLFNTFMDLLKINSPSREEEAAVRYIRDCLTALGLPWSTDEALNTYVHLPARHSMAPTLLLNAHVDTVRPTPDLVPHVRDGVIASDGSSVLGADDKAGVACILEVLRLLSESEVAHAALDIVITTGEEIGLVGSRAIDFYRISARQGLCLDSDGPVHHVIVAAPAQNDIRAVFLGRSAHAGVEPERGRSAIVAAARSIVAMSLGRIDFETTANVGMIQGGVARNIVPDRCEIIAEVRSRNVQKFEAQTAAMVRALEDGARALGVRVDIEVKENYRAYAHGAETPIVQRCVRALQRLGYEPELRATGGGSDANVFNEHGIDTVLLGVGYEAIHTPQERIALRALEELATVVFAIVTG